MSSADRGIAVITGASSGIGAATALRLADEGFEVVLGARRVDKLTAIAERAGGRARELDVTDDESVKSFAKACTGARVLVNNAGLASGLEDVQELSEKRVRLMWETNVMGLLRMTQALLGELESSGNGHIVNIGSIAAFEVYPGGGGYTASKHAGRALTRTLRQELVGRPLRITEINPGHVSTEFALVRFDQDSERSEQIYEGFTPLSAEDIADCVAWALTRPDNVNVDEIVLRARAQATATLIARN
ncbi:MAG: SDR family oxidoreductase [Actinomycetota bacterium]|jgi:NADP-dependent 3-hydroxy acid dehydrogenase YdfG|nr:SDR family oxidoreductase [Actinomycetota bacterium]